jgi:Rhodopirellula transposase DDE domain
VGGGRISKLKANPDIEPTFLLILKDHTAGNPQKEEVLWTDLSCTEIKDKLKERGLFVGTRIIKKLLYKHNFKKRKIQRRTSIKKVANRNEQFEKIAKLKQEYTQCGNPVISVDAKKRELIGQFYRAGHVYTQAEIAALDHDFPHLARGVAIPHGIFDLKNNTAHINIGISHETSEFACDSLKKWWVEKGRFNYPNATSILMLMDGGGSNSSRRHLFKEGLQKLANEIGVEIRIAHYPPYTSKWNPIEHRVFPHVTRAMQGVILSSHDLTKQLIEKTKTKAGLSVSVSLIDKVYELGKKVAKDFKKNMKIIFDDVLSQWNYRAVPMAA